MAGEDDDADLDALISKAHNDAAAERAAAAPAPPSEPAPPAAPEVPPAPAPPPPAPPTVPAPAPPSPPDPGPAPAEPAAPPAPAPPAPEPAKEQPTPPDERLSKAYRLAGIDPAAADAPEKLAAYLENRQAAPPAPAAPAAPEPAREPVTVDKIIADWAEKDPILDQLANEFVTESAGFKEARTELNSVNEQIDKLQRFLNPVKVNDELQAEPPDEFQTAKAERALDQALRQQEKLEKRCDAHEAKARRASQDYHGRIQGTKEDLESRIAEQRDIESMAVTFEQEWRAAFDAEFRALGLSEDLRDEFFQRVKDAGDLQNRRFLAAGKGEYFTDKAGFIRGQLKRESEGAEKYHRIKQQSVEAAVRRDAQVPAPPPAAPAPPAPTRAMNADEVLEESFRAAHAARVRR